MTNVTLSVLKDKAFAAMFGTGVARPMSFTSMGEKFFCGRNLCKI